MTKQELQKRLRSGQEKREANGGVFHGVACKAGAYRYEQVKSGKLLSAGPWRNNASAAARDMNAAN